MMIAPLLAAILSVSAVSAHAAPCESNEMTVAWEKINFALWLTDYTIPDSSPRTATLSYQGCWAGDGAERLENRSFASADGVFVITAVMTPGGSDGAGTLLLRRNGETAHLGTWGFHKIFYKGVGIDKVSVPNGNGRMVVKNVFVIPEGAVVKP